MSSVMEKPENVVMPVTRDKLIELSGLPEDEAESFLALGWIAPLPAELGPSSEDKSAVADSGPEERFDISGADKLARASAVCREFSVPPIAGAMITDLMDRVEELEAELERKTATERKTEQSPYGHPSSGRGGHTWTSTN
ncbi:MAG: hypothetical protein J5855_08685 [Mailhella sp.]|nr:hypothetical protein [Mailhella sp.]